MGLHISFDSLVLLSRQKDKTSLGKCGGSERNDSVWPICHDYNQMSENQRFTSNYKDQQRFAAKKAPTPITPQQPSSPPIQQQSSPPVSTFTPIPQEYIPQDLTIHIDPSGHKRFVNFKGQESLIRPFLNKYFGGTLNDPSTSLQQKQAAIRATKEDNLNTYKIYTGSKIYNYDPREIHLLSQFYESSFEPKEKKQMMDDFEGLRFTQSLSRKFFLAYTFILLLTRNKKWASMTRKNIFKIPTLLIPGSIWLNSHLSISIFQIRSILEHHNAYECMLATYENDNHLIY